MQRPMDRINFKWEDFEQEILGVAAIFSQLRAAPFAHTPPKIIADELKTLDDALTVALQAIGPLQLEHHEGQDITATPFNWPVVQALSTARGVMNDLRGITGQDPADYPTDLIKGLRELRDAARDARERERPGRGNSARRNQSSARMADLAKNFVFKFRSRFGYMPPMSKSGREVELLRRMFEAAGEFSNDVAEQLRKAIEQDTVGRELLPNARAAKSSKRPK
ncbi:hypothetical protein D3C78_1175880 [compost metagenome]